MQHIGDVAQLSAGRIHGVLCTQDSSCKVIHRGRQAAVPGTLCRTCTHVISHENNMHVNGQHTEQGFHQALPELLQALPVGSGASRLGTLATDTVNESEQDANVFLRHQAPAELLGIEAWDCLHTPKSAIRCWSGNLSVKLRCPSTQGINDAGPY